MERLEKGTLYDSPYGCEYCCDGNLHCSDTVQHIQEVISGNQKATAYWSRFTAAF